MLEVVTWGSTRFVLSLLLVACLAGTRIEAQTSSAAIPLWSGAAPLSKGSTDADSPSVDVYLPATNPTQTGVLVIPGGAYGYLAAPEGKPVAVWLQEHGVAAFVLHYRVSPYHYPAEMLDGLRAMRLIRSRAVEFHITADRIGVWGFSAGGHLASYLMTQWQQQLVPATDSVDAIDARPDFGILAYPVISMSPVVTHHGSHENLLGPNATPEQEAQLSSELHVGENSPPAFLFATTDDGVVPVQNSMALCTAYVQKHLPIEMHLFEHGPHGVVLAQNLPGASAWPNLLITWMARHGWMEK
ncbi:alpha/beta hydrolase [Terriglobus roseus]|nr:alpha/beta hydrolase [Terriglobus roseus]